MLAGFELHLFFERAWPERALTTQSFPFPFPLAARKAKTREDDNARLCGGGVVLLG